MLKIDVLRTQKEKVNYIIYDLEATCWDFKSDDFIQETIEIGAVMLNPYGEQLGEFNKFIRPVLHPTLSTYCHQLTSIDQILINRSDTFPDVIDDFMEWVGVFDDEEYFLCSWGSFDRKQFIQDCQLHDVEHEWVNRHLNLKTQYQDMKRLRRSCSLSRALRTEGIEALGTKHRGIDDARNLVEIFLKYRDVWVT